MPAVTRRRRGASGRGATDNALRVKRFVVWRHGEATCTDPITLTLDASHLDLSRFAGEVFTVRGPGFRWSWARFLWVYSAACREALWITSSSAGLMWRWNVSSVSITTSFGV